LSGPPVANPPVTDPFTIDPAQPISPAGPLAVRFQICETARLSDFSSTHGVLSVAADGFCFSFRAIRCATTIKKLLVNKRLCAEISAPRFWANSAENSAKAFSMTSIFDVCKSPKG
jgi:hypothetical protein